MARSSKPLVRLREQAQVGSIPTRLRQRPEDSRQEAEGRKTFTSFRKNLAALLGFSSQELADFVALTATFRSDISSPRTACFNLNTDISSAC
jgi:hypothetical protein